jgi:hypothetical protein
MLTAAAGAERAPSWAGYARYCRLREQGLRRAALQSLDDFLGAAARQLLEDWIAFRAEGGADFDEWCRVRGRSYEWQRHYFYPAK